MGYDAGHDVAVLQTSGASDLKTLSLGDSNSVNMGDSVHAVGNAGGTGRLITASGSVTGTNKAITVNDDQGGSESLSGLIETNAGIKPGDSGGPLLDSSSHAIGMDTAASVSSDGQTTTDGYAIPIDRALSIVEQIEVAATLRRCTPGRRRSSEWRSPPAATATARASRRSCPAAPPRTRASPRAT